jgi:hypothetical protein
MRGILNENQLQNDGGVVNDFHSVLNRCFGRCAAYRWEGQETVWLLLAVSVVGG